VQPKIYSLEEHRIPQEKIDPHVHYIIQKLRHYGFSAFLVGGSVRDLLLNHKPKDFDISTSAKPEEIRKIFRNSIIIGKRFRLVHVRFGKKAIEVSTFRAGDTQKSSLVIRDNVWGSEEEDVLRRDFTINGLFYDPQEQTIIDYVDGFGDVEKKLLRAIGDPNLRFLQDPVRMIRLLKFQARFGFSIEEATSQALLSCQKEILKSSQARILEELLRMLESGSAKEFFSLLTENGLLHSLLPKLSAFLTQKNHTIYKYLESADLITRHISPQTLHRSTLISCLLFPLLEERLQQQYFSKGQKAHLGLVSEAAHQLINDIFLPFFQVPRELKAMIASILTTQYRFVPKHTSWKTQKPRVPNDPFFQLAIEFFKIRCSLYADLVEVFEFWETAIFHRFKNKSSAENSNPPLKIKI
jgi:poly(A) polymerase